eukprot:gene3151-4140_t
MMGTGPVTDLASAARAAQDLAAQGDTVIVTAGGAGLAAVGLDGAELQVAAEKVKVVSSHGAGDAFIGALAVQLADGRSAARGGALIGVFFDQLRSFGAVGIDRTAHAVCHQGTRRGGLHQTRSAMPRLAQPQRPLIGIQDQRLAVVDRFQVGASVERHHSTSDQIPPSLPQPAQGHGGTVRAGDVPRQPRAVWPRTPFIKPRGQHQTTPRADRLAE